MLLILLVVFLTLVCYLVRRNYQYWKKRGVNGPNPTFFFGNLAKSVFLKKQIGEVYTDIYNKYNQDSVVGVFKFFTPALLIRHPDLIKEVTIKSFSHFRDNDLAVDKKNDPIFGRNPFALKGEEWRRVRSQLTSGFTSGKMKWLYPYLQTNGTKMVKYLETQKSYEAKELSMRFALNNVGDAVFGIEPKCFDEDNSEFRQLSKDFFRPGGWMDVAIVLTVVFPVLTKIIPIRIVPKVVERKVMKMVSETLKHRQENNIVRNDFLHILKELKNTCPEITDMDITAQAFVFLIDGTEGGATVMSFVLYHLSVNPEAQKKLREEVRKVFEDNEELPYEVLQSLPYLDAVINESLRISPPVYFLQKLCTETFDLTLKETAKPLHVTKGQSIILPVLGVQNDPKYFEEPEIFKPERFLGDNKDKIRKCTFMPFGEGPRACLGQRFGILQIKVGLCYIINHYEITLNPKTEVPLKLNPASLSVAPIGGLWIDFKKIK